MWVWPASNPAGLQVGGVQACESKHAHLPQATPLGKAIMRSSQATWQGQLHWQVAAGTQAQRERTLAGFLIFLLTMAESDPPPPSETATAGPASSGGTMTEVAVRALIRQEVSAAVAAALAPPTGPLQSGECVFIPVLWACERLGGGKRKVARRGVIFHSFPFSLQLGSTSSTHTTLFDA